MKKNIFTKSKNIFLYKTLLVVVIVTLGIFAIYYPRDVNQTEYFYDFESDTINSFPSGFVGIGRSTVHTKVVEWDNNDGHDGKVVEISYLDRVYLDEVNYSGIELNTLFNKASSGHISFDIYLVESLGIAIDVCQEDLIYDRKDDISIRIAYGDPPLFTVVDSSGKIKEISSSLRLLKWHRFEIEFNCQENKWSIEVHRGTRSIGSGNFSFYVRPLYLQQLYFATYKLGNKFYIDNVHILLDNIL